jgi:hypothetical protein
MSSLLTRGLRLVMWLVWINLANLGIVRLLQKLRSADRTLGRIAWADWSAGALKAVALVSLVGLLTSAWVAVPGEVFADDGAPDPTSPEPTSLVAPAGPPQAPIFFNDPRVLAVTIPDLPGGVHAWVRMGDDTTRLLQFQYSVIYGRLPGNGQLFPLDPYIAVNVLIADTDEHAAQAWQGQYAKPGPRQRPGAELAPIADEQTYSLGTNLIDVRARQDNVILQAIEWTSGTQSISLDDTVTLVRIMATRVRDLAH